MLIAPAKSVISIRTLAFAGFAVIACAMTAAGSGSLFRM